MDGMLKIDWFNLFVLASMAATATIGLRSGNLAPVFPRVTRLETPKRYWLGIAACTGLVALNIVRLLLLIRPR
jgi:hypothetical protein